MPLNIYTSNRMEHLLDALATVLQPPLASPFEPEVIVMQSKGMQRWLSMELAKRFGVWANGQYPFPNSFVTQLFARVLTDLGDSDPFSPGVMTWKIFGLLPDCIGNAVFAPLRHYLVDDRDDLKRFQLAQKIADTFDQYTLYRADMLKRWEQTDVSGSDEAWQALLWRKLVAGSEGQHRGRLKEQFCNLIGAAAPNPMLLPERVSLFGISYLPNYHLEIIAAAAQVTEINLFLLSPTREYWADILSEKSLARLAAEERDLRIEGNPLLASLGRLGRDFSGMAIELGTLAVRDMDLYAEPEGDGLLHSIQSDILNLNGAEKGTIRKTITKGDRSVQIHSCHSPMREVEVLYDQILSLLENEPGLESRDILVMTPDIETYAPYITAVFDGVRDQNRRIPFSIADRRLASEGEVASALIRLLALPGSRLGVVQLLDILSLSPVRRKYGLEEEDLATIRDWLERTHVRWGLDEQDRLDLGLPGYRSNSWRAGLDRLLLGYAMSDLDRNLFNNMLPFDDMEGSIVLLLGKLYDFVDRVGQVVHELDRPRPLRDWSEQVRNLLNEFVVSEDDTARELAVISRLVEELVQQEQQSGYGGEISFAVIRALVSSSLEQEQKGLGFMTGGVTFCAMLPMRSIPFKVIAMIGMNDGAFPRQNSAQGFDQIAQSPPKRGDRSLRDEDRYLFLETLLSARSCLYISYIGQSIRDNSEMPPSVLVSELLDAIRRGFVPDGGGCTVEHQLVTRHRLQAFSRQYFSGDPQLFSYSGDNCRALIEKQSGGANPALFMPIPMAEPDQEWRDVPLAKLLRFFANPARFFLENRLGIRLENIAEALEEREPFATEGLISYTLKSEILDAALKGDNPELLLPKVRSLGILPPARHGDLLFAEQVSEVKKLAGTVSGTIGAAAALPHLDVDLGIGGFRLYGRLNQIWPERMYRYRCAKTKAKDLIRCWIEHLVLNAAGVEGYPRGSMLIMADKCASFTPVADPQTLLQSILELYWQGLRTPLPFFPESALAYAGSKIPWDLGKARAKWKDDSYNDIPGEGSDPCFRLCFGKLDPFDAEFERISRLLLEPLLRHRGQVPS